MAGSWILAACSSPWHFQILQKFPKLSIFNVWYLQVLGFYDVNSHAVRAGGGAFRGRGLYPITRYYSKFILSPGITQKFILSPGITQKLILTPSITWKIILSQGSPWKFSDIYFFVYPITRSTNKMTNPSANNSYPLGCKKTRKAIVKRIRAPKQHKSIFFSSKCGWYNDFFAALWTTPV